MDQNEILRKNQSNSPKDEFLSYTNKQIFLITHNIASIVTFLLSIFLPEPQQYLFSILFYGEAIIAAVVGVKFVIHHPSRSNNKLEYLVILIAYIGFVLLFTYFAIDDLTALVTLTQ